MNALPLPRIVCIAGTDTDAGKTVVTAGLLRAFGRCGVAAQAIKPVQTGCLAGQPAGNDAGVYAAAAPGATIRTLHSFARPCSPHLAASLEGKTLSIDSIADEIFHCSRNSAIALVEGSGGLLVPVNSGATFLDLFAQLDAPVILVVANRLGAINHTLLSLEALASRNIQTHGIVLVETTPALTVEEQEMRQNNGQTIAAFGKVPVLASLPHCEALASAQWERAWEAIATCLMPLARDLLTSRVGDAETPLTEFDKLHLWHPYTSAVNPLPVYEAVATSGTHIHLRDGTRLVDGMASWWAAIHGYNVPRLQQALIRQTRTMPHVMFGGLTHEPAVTLGRKLLALAPEGLSRVFFADSGSVAVEVALKMAVQFQQATGRVEKTTCMTFRGGYHGDTLGAMSVCDPVNGMHTLFQAILPQQVFVDRPECAFDAPWRPEFREGLEQAFAVHAPTAAAFILEPVVQGAGGMWLYHPEYLRVVRELCDRHGVLLIADEIATGFGRTGKMFACQWAGISPDILCVGKALTGGVMSLAATLATDRVACGISRGGGVLMHGPTFMGNPLACAVASASLDLLVETPWQERLARMQELLMQGLAPCRLLPGVNNVRVLGGIGVVEMESPVNVAQLQKYFICQWGVWIRPFARLIYVMPPYCTPEREVNLLTQAITGAVQEGAWQ